MHFQTKHYQNSMARANGLTPPYQVGPVGLPGLEKANLEQIMAENAAVFSNVGAPNLPPMNMPPQPHPMSVDMVPGGLNPEISMANQILAEETQARQDYLMRSQEFLERGPNSPMQPPVPWGRPEQATVESQMSYLLNSQVHLSRCLLFHHVHVLTYLVIRC